MFFGQLIYMHARKQYDCSYSDCDFPIHIGDLHRGLVVGKGEKRFTRRLHNQCFEPFFQEAYESRQAAIETRAHQPRPSRRIPSEHAAERTRLLHQIGVHKLALIRAYIRQNSTSARRHKTKLADLIGALNDAKFGKPYHWKFRELLSYIAQGVDDDISIYDASRADNDDPTLARELLRRTGSAVPAEHDGSSDGGVRVVSVVADNVQMSRLQVLAAIRSDRGIPEAFELLGRTIRGMGEPFIFGDLDHDDFYGFMKQSINQMNVYLEDNQMLGHYFTLLGEAFRSGERPI